MLMENVSRALIMAGGILISVLVIGLIAFVISIFGGFSSNIHSDMSETQIGQFNEKFLEKDGRIDITAQEISTLINFAKSQNDKNEIPIKDITLDTNRRV